MADQASQATTATVLARPAHSSTQDPTTELLTAADVLYANELRRGRLWVILTGHLAVIGLVSAAIVDDPGWWARVILAASCGVLLIASFIAGRILRRRDHYDATEAAIYGYLSLSVVVPAYYFFGWFSPVLVVVCLGAIIFAMGHTLRALIAMAIAISATHLTMGALVIAGVLRDVGVASVRIHDTRVAVVVLVGSQALFVLTFIVGRQLRAHAQDGVERYGQAVRESTRRDVLLQEAIDELHRARKVGDPGRFTGLELGSFRLGVVLGRGGMGEVYEASHIGTGEPAAVKLLGSGPYDERAARRFEREISLAAALDSPHIVKVLEHSAPEDAMPYLVMERLRGTTLSEELRGHLGVGGSLQMLREVAEAVDTAHESGVIHRDLKPQNIFHHVSDGEDIWKVLDFGVSKLAGGQSSLTGLGLVGTPSYMSPEQAAGREVDSRSDLFSLACVAYRCLTGRPAFRGSMTVVLRQISAEMPVRPSLVAQLPLEVDHVLAVGLAKAPDDRFESAFDLVSALTAACKADIAPQLQRRADALLVRMPWTEGRV